MWGQNQLECVCAFARTNWICFLWCFYSSLWVFWIHLVIGNHVSGSSTHTFEWGNIDTPSCHSESISHHMWVWYFLFVCARAVHIPYMHRIIGVCLCVYMARRKSTPKNNVHTLFFFRLSAQLTHKKIMSKDAPFLVHSYQLFRSHTHVRTHGQQLMGVCGSLFCMGVASSDGC